MDAAEGRQGGRIGRPFSLAKVPAMGGHLLYARKVISSTEQTLAGLRPASDRRRQGNPTQSDRLQRSTYLGRAASSSCFDCTKSSAGASPCAPRFWEVTPCSASTGVHRRRTGIRCTFRPPGSPGNIYAGTRITVRITTRPC